jgi:hypothetical protein
MTLTTKSCHRVCNRLASSEKIVLTAEVMVTAYTRVDLTLIEDTFRLKMPVIGVEKGYQIFTFATDARQGPVELLIIKHAVALDTLLNASLEFSIPIVGHVTDIIISFTSSSSMTRTSPALQHLESRDK